MADFETIARWFLWIGGGFFLIAYALPLLIVPLRWSRLFRWKLPGDRDLTVYLGRCLGGVSVAIVYLFFRASTSPTFYPVMFELIIAVGLLMTIVHVIGALQRAQPWTETVEIGLYAGLSGMAVWIYVGL